MTARDFNFFINCNMESYICLHKWNKYHYDRTVIHVEFSHPYRPVLTNKKNVSSFCLIWRDRLKSLWPQIKIWWKRLFLLNQPRTFYSKFQNLLEYYIIQDIAINVQTVCLYCTTQVVQPFHLTRTVVSFKSYACIT